MKTFIALLVLLVCSQALKAQTAGSWVNVSPPGEHFAVQMPEGHVVISQNYSFDGFEVSGRTYSSTANDVDYSVWSLVNENPASTNPPGNETYLDACADLVWESILKPLRNQVPKSPEYVSRMSYHGELSKLAPGREYTIMLGNQPGLARFYATGQQIYVLTVLNAEAKNPVSKRFINSFGLKAPGKTEALTVEEESRQILLLPSAPALAGAGVGPGGGRNQGDNNAKAGTGEPETKENGSTDFDRVFTGKEVTQKARVLAKPEPQYTESARKYGVHGTVVIRGVFSGSGEVTNMRVLSRLPHGLTERALEAARKISFAPAQKDGYPVSMFIQLEYNFNLY